MEITIKKIMNVNVLQEKNRIQKYQKTDPYMYMSHCMRVYWCLHIDAHAIYLACQSVSRNQATLFL